MLFTIQKSGFDSVPAGTYQGVFRELSQIETKNGKAYRWTFESDDKKLISGLSDAEHPPTVKNKTGRWLSALSGKALNAGVTINPDDYKGKRYLIIVVAVNETTKLETFTPLNN